MHTTTISSKGRTTVPIKIRKLLNLKAGSNVYWQILETKGPIKNVVITSPSKQSLAELRGSAKDLYKKYGGGRKYLEGERESWQ